MINDINLGLSEMVTEKDQRKQIQKQKGVP